MQDEQQQTGPQEYKYWGFISYSHADEKWADWLHKALETYAVPKQLVGKPTKYGPIPKRAFPIFRDRDELPSSADLGDKLTAALTGSRYLIVICSPRAVGSQWVNEEIKTFKSLGRESQVLCLIVDGEPYASLNPQLGLEECFPEPVRYQVDENRNLTDIRTEPIAADARKGKDGKPNSRLKLLSGMFNVNFSDLKQRDHERAQRRLKQILAGVMVLFVVFLLLGVNLFIQKKKADQATIRAQENEQAATRAMNSAVEQKALADKSAQEAIEQAERARVAEADATKQRDNAVEQEKKAVANAERAQIAEKDATKQRDQALANLTRAVEAEKDANIQRDKAVENATRAQIAEQEAKDNARRAFMALSTSDFNEGSRLAEEGNEETAIAYLARALNWDPENSSAEARLISVLSDKNWSLPRTAPLQHEGKVVDVDYSPDGKHIVTVSGSAAQIWSVETGERVGEAMRHRNSVRGVRYSSDGKRIVTASDPDAKVWDAATGKELGAGLNHTGKVEMARFSRDGSRVVTCSADRTVKIWETETGKEVVTIKIEGSPASVDFSADGSSVVVGYGSVAQMYNAKSGGLVGAPMKHAGFVVAVFGPNGKYVATASLDKSARVWDARSGAPVSEPLNHEGRVLNVTFSPSGLHVVTSSDDDTARIWEIATGQSVGEPLRHALDVTSANVSPNGRWVATSSPDGVAKVWSMKTGKPALEPIKFRGPVTAARFSNDGRSLVIGSEDQTAQVWTCLAGQPKSEPLMHDDIQLNWASFSSDARYVVTGGNDQQARIWDIGTGKLLTEPLIQGGRPIYAEFTPDDKRLLVTTDNGYLQIWDVATGKAVGGRYKSSDKITSAQYSADGSSILVVERYVAKVLDPATLKERFTAKVEHRDSRARRYILSGNFNSDGSLFVTAGDDKSARIWDARTGAPKGEPFMHDDGVTDAVFSRDGKYIATGSKDRTARFWEVATGKQMTEPMQHVRAVNSVDLSPDGAYLIAACDDSTVRVWRTATGQSGAEPLQHDGAVWSARFSPDGRMVVSYGKEKLARVWETASWKLVTEPLAHTAQINSAVFSKDGAFVATASTDKTARIWQISIPGEVPKWLTQLAETVGGFRMVESGGGTELVLDPWEKIAAVRTAMASDGTDKVYANWGNWFLADRASRAVSSYASLSVTDYVASKVEAADAASLEEALDLQPDHALALARLGMGSSDETMAGFYTDLAVQYEPENYDALWLRGAVLHRQQNYSDAWPYLERAVKLDPRAVEDFGPEGADFKSANSKGSISQGWLPKGWIDNNADKRYDVTYTKLPDGPPATDAAIGITARGPAGRAELLGPRFIVRASASRVIEFWARGPKGRAITVSARAFTGRKGDRMSTVASAPPIRLTEEWKQYSVNVRPAQDSAAEVVFQVPTSSTGQRVDIADVVVRVR